MKKKIVLFIFFILILFFIENISFAKYVIYKNLNAVSISVHISVNEQTSQ